MHRFVFSPTTKRILTVASHGLVASTALLFARANYVSHSEGDLVSPPSFGIASLNGIRSKRSDDDGDDETLDSLILIGKYLNYSLL